MPKKFDRIWTEKIVAMSKEGYSIGGIHKWLKTCGVQMDHRSVWYYAKGRQKERCVRKSKTTQEVRKLIDSMTQENDEYSAAQIKKKLERHHKIKLSESSIRVVRRELRGVYGAAKRAKLFDRSRKLESNLRACIPVEQGSETSKGMTTRTTAKMEKENLPIPPSNGKENAASTEKPQHIIKKESKDEQPEDQVLQPSQEPIQVTNASESHVATANHLQDHINILAKDEVMAEEEHSPSTQPKPHATPGASHKVVDFTAATSPMLQPFSGGATCHCGAQKILDNLEATILELLNTFCDQINNKIKESLAIGLSTIQDIIASIPSVVQNALEKATNPKAHCAAQADLVHTEVWQQPQTIKAELEEDQQSSILTLPFQAPLLHQEMQADLPQPSGVYTAFEVFNNQLLEPPSLCETTQVKEEVNQERISPPLAALVESSNALSTEHSLSAILPLMVGAPIVNFEHLAVDDTTLAHLRRKCNNDPSKFALYLFKELVPFHTYKGWVHNVNYDGSRGKRALPESLRDAIITETARQFTLNKKTSHSVKGVINSLLRTPRANPW